MSKICYVLTIEGQPVYVSPDPELVAKRGIMENACTWQGDDMLVNYCVYDDGDVCVSNTYLTCPHCDGSLFTSNSCESGYDLQCLYDDEDFYFCEIEDTSIYADECNHIMRAIEKGEV